MCMVNTVSKLVLRHLKNTGRPNMTNSPSPLTAPAPPLRLPVRMSRHHTTHDMFGGIGGESDVMQYSHTGSRVQVTSELSLSLLIPRSACFHNARRAFKPRPILGASAVFRDTARGRVVSDDFLWLNRIFAALAIMYSTE